MKLRRLSIHSPRFEVDRLYGGLPMTTITGVSRLMWLASFASSESQRRTERAGVGVMLLEGVGEVDLESRVRPVSCRLCRSICGEALLHRRRHQKTLEAVPPLRRRQSRDRRGRRSEQQSCSAHRAAKPHQGPHPPPASPNSRSSLRCAMAYDAISSSKPFKRGIRCSQHTSPTRPVDSQSLCVSAL